MNTSVISNLVIREKNYNLNIFPKIRNMTRYTYPETVNAKQIAKK